MDECKGCHRQMIGACALLSHDTDENIYYKADRKPKDCPCMICLIKGICTKTCDDRLEFWNIEYDRIWQTTRRAGAYIVKPVVNRF